MATKIFINLPVSDLQKSVDFFTQLGFVFNPNFTDENATCMIVNEAAFVMLLVKPFFQSFTHKTLVDAHQSTEVLTALSRENRAEVDTFLEKALAAGATENRPADDLGFMYSRSFSDLDGHIWEIHWMDPNYQGVNP